MSADWSRRFGESVLRGIEEHRHEQANTHAMRVPSPAYLVHRECAALLTRQKGAARESGATGPVQHPTTSAPIVRVPRRANSAPVRKGAPNIRGLGKLRYGVEQTFALLHQFKRLAVRWERRLELHEAFITLACSLICWRRLKKTQP